MENKLNKGFIDTFGHLDLFAQQVVEGFITGIHKSPFHGFSVEFAEHRLYNQGESIKDIDWKVYGRTDKLFIKKYEEETNLRCQVVIDNSTSMYYPRHKEPHFNKPNKIIFSVHAAAVLFNIMRRQRDAYGLTLFSDKIEFQSATRSNALHYNFLLSELEKLLKPDNTPKKTSLSAVLHQIADVIHKRSLVIIFSDMLDSVDELQAILPALQHLKHNKHEVVLFHVFEKSSEYDFKFENRPYKFIDIENEEEIKLNPYEIRQDYLEKMKSFRDDLYIKCRQYNIDIIEADINNGFKQILFPFFVKRQKLH